MVCFSFWCWEPTDIQDIPSTVIFSWAGDVPAGAADSACAREGDYITITKGVPIPRHPYLTQEEEEVKKRRASILLLSLEEEAGLLSSWVPSAGGTALLGWGALGWHSRVPARHKAQQESFSELFNWPAPTALEPASWCVRESKYFFWGVLRKYFLHHLWIFPG